MDLWVHSNGGTGGYVHETKRALLRTDGQGRYSYRTIRPGSYPDTGAAAHPLRRLASGALK
jgi:protocatechuate 3,4-dioxygenase beta subunit